MASRFASGVSSFFQNIFKDLIIKAQISHQAFELSVVYLEGPQLPGIVTMHVTVFITPVVEGLL